MSCALCWVGCLPLYCWLNLLLTGQTEDSTDKNTSGNAYMLEYRNTQLVAPLVRAEEAIATELRQVRHAHCMVVLSLDLF